LIGNLLTGTDSPVNMLSLTIASPERRNMSQGKNVSCDSVKFTMSPGTSVVESLSCPKN
jgi:hypothetical protein